MAEIININTEAFRTWISEYKGIMDEVSSETRDMAKIISELGGAFDGEIAQTLTVYGDNINACAGSLEQLSTDFSADLEKVNERFMRFEKETVEAMKELSRSGF